MPIQQHDACIVVPHHGGGIFSLFNKVITCLETYRRVTVNFPSAQTLYKCVTEKNLWEVICHPLSNAPLDGEPCDIVQSYPHTRYTSRRAGKLYRQDGSWRWRLHKQFEKIEVKHAVLELSQSIFPDLVPQCITVLHRSEPGLAREQLTGLLPSVDDMCAAVNSVSEHGPVLVCADSDEAINEFRSRLGDRMMTWDALDKVATADQLPHSRHTYGSDHVRNMFARSLALSRSAHLVHPVSNIATAVLYMNPLLAHTFVEVTRPPSKNGADRP